MNKNIITESKPKINSPKTKTFKKSIAKLITYCKKYLPIIILAIILAIAGTILTLVGPDKLGELTNKISQGIFSPVGFDLAGIGSIAIFLVIIYSLSFVLTYFQGFIMAIVTQKVSKKLRTELSDKINKLPLKYLDKTPHGDTLSRITNDVDTIGQTLNNSTASLISAIILLLGSAFMMFITNWILAISAIGASVLGFFIMGLIMAKSQKYFNKQQQSLGELNGHIEENYTGHNIVKINNGIENAQKEFVEINNTLYNSAWKSQFLSGLMMPLMSFIGNLGYVIVCVIGAILCVNGTIEIGVIVSFMIYIRLFTQPLATIAQSATSLQSVASASERVFSFLKESELESEDLKTQKLNVKKIKGIVEFKNVVFGYDKDKTIIHNFSASVKAGQKIAIVGPTGAGKTTIINLLMRFYEIDHGDIFIDNINVKDLTRENIHDIFSMVLQDTWMFEGTLKENIKYNKQNVSDNQIIKVCKTIGIDHFIQTLPNGYNTIIDDNINISTGQKQLLTIARAMIQNSPMLILDEATSSVDTRTEIQIQNAMDKLTKNRTSFVIAHRLSTIKNADLILVMKDGNIIEQGNHNDLIDQNGFYCELYNSQFSDNEWNKKKQLWKRVVFSTGALRKSGWLCPQLLRSCGWKFFPKNFHCVPFGTTPKAPPTYCTN